MQGNFNITSSFSNKLIIVIIPFVNMHILITGFHTFLIVLFGRICLNIQFISNDDHCIHSHNIVVMFKGEFRCRSVLGLDQDLALTK